MINGDKELVLRKTEFLSDQVPGEADGFVFEIVAEREIAQHFKESMVTRRIADIVQIVVLPAGANAFLRGRGAIIGAMFKTGEDILELHHARIGEHERRIVTRNERARWNDLMPVLAEIIEECGPNLVDASHKSPLGFTALHGHSSAESCINYPVQTPTAANRHRRPEALSHC